MALGLLYDTVKKPTVQIDAVTPPSDGRRSLSSEEAPWGLKVYLFRYLGVLFVRRIFIFPYVTLHARLYEVSMATSVVGEDQRPLKLVGAEIDLVFPRHHRIGAEREASAGKKSWQPQSQWGLWRAWFAYVPEVVSWARQIQIPTSSTELPSSIHQPSLSP